MPIHKRPQDLMLVVLLSIAILYGLLFSLPEGLGVPVSSDSPWPPLRALHGWAVAQEPAHVAPPPSLVASCLFDGFFQAPILIVIVYGLIRQRRWVRAVAPIYAAAAVTNMFFYFAQTFLGPHPPTNLGVYLPFNLPWLIVPLWLALRASSADYRRGAERDRVRPMSSGLRIRVFDDSDTEDVVALWQTCFPNDPPRNEPRGVVARKLAKDRDLFIVAEEIADGRSRIVGSAIGGWDGFRGWVYHVATAPTHRGTGIGRALMEEVEARLRARGCPKLNIQVRSGNASVIAFYETLGFVRDDVTGFGKVLD